MRGCPTTADEIDRFMRDAVAEQLLALAEPAVVRDGGVNDRAKAPSALILAPHTDGFTYGQQPPDVLGLLCVHASDAGGDSFLVDGYEMLAALDDDGDHELIEFLRTSPIEQTDPGNERFRDTCVAQTGGGRELMRRFAFQAPDTDADAAEQARQSALLERWAARLDEAAALAPRTKLLPGDLLLVDNYRMFHGRDPYDDPERTMLRIWAWSTDSNGLPPMEVFSDARQNTG